MLPGNVRGSSLPVELWHGAADVVAELMVGQVDLLVAGLVKFGRRRGRSRGHALQRWRRRLRDDLLDTRGGVRGAVKGLSGFGGGMDSIHVSGVHLIILKLFI